MYFLRSVTSETSNMSGIKLKCKSQKGQHLLSKLTSSSTIGDLCLSVSHVTDIPIDFLVIKVGYPPKEISTANVNQPLSDVPLISGGTLVVEQSTTKRQSEPQSATVTCERSSTLMKKSVPADNSCLFTSVHFVMNNGDTVKPNIKMLRDLIATVVASNRDTYNEGFLGKPNKDYCKWIKLDSSWGGAIEVSILASYYKVEIDVVDIKTARIDRFGEDRNYERRVFLLYDGVHYDPLILESNHPTRQTQPLFSITDGLIMSQAMELARDCKSSKLYTDLHNLTIQCFVCDRAFAGARDAQVHANDTGHTQFKEL